MEEEMDIEESYYYEFRSHYKDVRMDEQVSTDEGDCNDSIDVEHDVLDNAAEMNIADDENSDGREDIDYESNIESDASWADNNSIGYDSEDLIEIESIGSLD
jgi:hypothetical protein